MRLARRPLGSLPAHWEPGRAPNYHVAFPPSPPFGASSLFLAHIHNLTLARPCSSSNRTKTPPFYICSSLYLHGRNDIRPVPSFSDSNMVERANSRGIRHKRTHSRLNTPEPLLQRTLQIDPNLFSILVASRVSPIESFHKDLALSVATELTEASPLQIRDFFRSDDRLPNSTSTIQYKHIKSTMTSASPLTPTFYGHIASTQDALLLFEACLNGAPNHVARRSYDRERVSLIKSGNIFIYEEHSSGIKRWTDGIVWSPSRILGNFLVYRELEYPFPPGEKKRAMKRSKTSPGISKQRLFGSSTSEMSEGYKAASIATSSFGSPSASSLNKEREGSLIGSLVDSYRFKEEGLIKKAVSVTIRGVSHHLVSYYTIADVINNKFSMPSKDPRSKHITPRADLLTRQNFRAPIDEVDSMDHIDNRFVYATCPYARNNYEMTNQAISHRPKSLPIPHTGYSSGSNMFGNYSVSTPSASYNNLGQGSTGTPYKSQFAPSPGICQAPKTENYELGSYRQQRYSSVIGIGTNTVRSQMLPVTTNFARRPSSFQQATSMNSGFSGISSSFSDLKLTTDSGYSSQCFYSGLKDTCHTAHNYTRHGSLPMPAHKPSYDRVNAEHGHYLASHEQWASTSAS